MRTKDYIQKFNLGNETTEKQYSLFLKDFKEEFESRIELTLATRTAKGMDTPFSLFQILVKEANIKWDSISAHKPGFPLPQKLWNQFYASCVIKLREKYYPKEHEDICNRRRKRELLENTLNNPDPDPEDYLD